MSQKIITQKVPNFRWEKGCMDWRRALVFAWYPTDRLRTQRPVRTSLAQFGAKPWLAGYNTR